VDSIRSTISTTYPIRALGDTLSEAIARKIMQEILSGNLKPGQRIRQDEYSIALGTSKTPLREALKRLEASGWIEIGSYRGATVKRLDPQELEKIYVARALLEGFAAGVAAQKRDPSLISALEELVDDMTKFGPGDAERAEQLNDQFHMTLYAACGSEGLVSSLRDNWVRALRFRIFYWTDSESWASSTSDHQRILRAVKRGQATLVEALVLEHLLAGMSKIRDRIDGTSSASPIIQALLERSLALRELPW